MASTGEDGNGCDEATISDKVVVCVEENRHSTLSAIAQGVPMVWPTDLNSGREEFSSICVGEDDFRSSTLTHSPAITLRLRDQAVWWAIRPYKMEMCVHRLGRRLRPALTVNVEGLKADGIYTFFLDLIPKDQDIYAYHSGHWTPIHITRPYPPSHRASLIYVSNIAYKLGSDLMAHGVNFMSAKITSDESMPASRNEVKFATASTRSITAAKCTSALQTALNFRSLLYTPYFYVQIFVYQRQIYLPRYHIVRQLTAEEVNAMLQSEDGCKNESLDYYEHVGTYIIPETEFITVSKYYNARVAAVKTGAYIIASPIKAYLVPPSC